MKLTAVFEPAKEGGYTCFVEEIPAAISQGETVEEAKANLPRCLEAGSRMPARAGREGAFAAGLARDDRIRWRMRLADLERHLRERDCVFHRQGGADASWFKKALSGRVYFAAADF